MTPQLKPKSASPEIAEKALEQCEKAWFDSVMFPKYETRRIISSAIAAALEAQKKQDKLLFRAACSGLWYSNPNAAGSIDCVQVGDVQFAFSPSAVAESVEVSGQSPALISVLGERRRQELKWGEQNHDPFTYLTVLIEEVGEFAQAALHHRFGGPEAFGVREEAVQVAAVALAIIECVDRAKWAWPLHDGETAPKANSLRFSDTPSVSSGGEQGADPVTSHNLSGSTGSETCEGSCTGDHDASAASSPLSDGGSSASPAQIPRTVGSADTSDAPLPVIPLPAGVEFRNGGVICDMLNGPCSCGAWHKIEDLPWRIVNQLKTLSVGHGNKNQGADPVTPKPTGKTLELAKELRSVLRITAYDATSWNRAETLADEIISLLAPSCASSAEERVLSRNQPNLMTTPGNPSQEFEQFLLAIQKPQPAIDTFTSEALMMIYLSIGKECLK